MTKGLKKGINGSQQTQVPFNSDFKSGTWLFYLASLLAIVVCMFSLTGEFVLDDRLVLVEHPIIQDKLSIWQLFFLDQWGRPLSGEVTTYRPIMPLIWWPIWHIFPNNPLAFRLFTLFLHLAAIITIIRVGRLFTNDKWIVAFASLLFAVHAVHSEVLGSTAHQNEILVFIFCMWALYFIEKQALPISLLLLLLAVLIKESAIVFYMIVILYLAARREIGKRIFFVICILMSAGLMIGVQLSLDRAPFIIGNMDNLSYDAQGVERVLHGLYNIGRAMSLMIVPSGLAPFHGYASIDLSTETLLPYAIIGGFTLFGTTAGLIWSILKKRSGLVLGISILMGPLVLQSNLFIQTFAELSERWLYTPSLSVCLMLSGILMVFFRFLREKRLGWFGIFCLASIVVMHLFISWKILIAWKNNESLMAFAVRQEPAAYQSRYFHAKYLLQKEQIYEGLWYVTTSAMIKREYFKTKGQSGRDKFSELSQLDKLSIKERFRLAPHAIEPQQPCEYVIGSLSETAKLKPAPPPEILTILARMYAMQGFTDCFAAPGAP